MIYLHDDHEKPIKQTSVCPILAGVLIDMEMRIFPPQVKYHLEESLKIVSRFREELEKMFGEDCIFSD